MKKYRIAAILMIVHGGMIEIGGCLMFMLALAAGAPAMNLNFTFLMPYLQENLNQVLIIGGIFGAVRLVGAIGLLMNRMWGLALSVIICIITMALMIFMLPAGIIDGILACPALILILMQYYKGKNI